MFLSFLSKVKIVMLTHGFSYQLSDFSMTLINTTGSNKADHGLHLQIIEGFEYLFIVRS